MLTLFKGKSAHYLGHNPAGSVSVWLLLGLGLCICITGVLALQDGVSDLVVNLHGLATDVMLGVIALHLIGVLVSSILHRENLVRSMFTGFKPVPRQKSAESDHGILHAYHWVSLLMVAAVVIFWFAYVKRPLG